MAFDLDKYPDTAVLSTREVAEWLGCSSPRVVSAMGLTPVASIGLGRHYLASTVKAHLVGKPARPELKLRKAS